MQTHRQVLQTWDRQLRALLPAVRRTQLTVLAAFSLGVLWSGSLTLLTVAASLPWPVMDLSRERRLRRWLANPRVTVATLWPPVRQALLAHRAGQELLLVFDPTPLGAYATILVLGLVVHKRILPLAWQVVPQQQAWDEPQAVYLQRLTQQVAQALPAGCTVTLLVDQGLTSAEVFDLCRQRGWHLVGRLSADPQQGPKVRLPDGRELASVWELVTGPGQRWFGVVTLFQRAGWRQLYLSIVWQPGYERPWLLLSDRPAGAARVREYRRRAHCEATFEDSKKRGWDLERTKVRDRARLDRLLLVLILALWWAHALGQRAIRQGLRRRFDRSDRRDLGVMRLGRRWLTELLRQDQVPPLLFRQPALGRFRGLY